MTHLNKVRLVVLLILLLINWGLFVLFHDILSIDSYPIVIILTLVIDWSLLVILHDILTGKSFYKDVLNHLKIVRSSFDQLDSKWKSSKNKSEIIVSLTSIPDRIDLLELTLKSLLIQKRLPKKIVLNLPFKTHVSKKEYHIPVWLSKLNSVQINRIETDYGPASKFIPTLEAHPDDQQILVVDDDHLYPPTFIQDFEKASEKYPDYILTGSGWDVPEDLVDRDTTIAMNLLRIPPAPIKGSQIKKIKKTDIIQGYSGYLIKGRFFDLQTLKDFPEDQPILRLVDDIWISAHALVDKYTLPLRRFCFTTRKIRILSRSSSLASVNNRGKTRDEDRHNSIAIRYFKHKWTIGKTTKE